MIKKLTALIMVLMFTFFAVACDKSEEKEPTQAKKTQPDFKIGAVFIGDENAQSTVSHTNSIVKAAKELDIDDSQLMYKYSVKSDEKCYDVIKGLVDDGCDLVISDSRKHQEFFEKAADEFEDTEFVVIGGDTAKTADIPNLHNAYTRIYQSRYLCGVVAGAKIEEFIEKDLLKAENFDKDGKIKIGYVGGLPSSEVSSSYSAFYLGVKSVHADVSMCVQYTNKRCDEKAETETANQLISQGCVVIVQHSTSKGVQAAVKSAIESDVLCCCVGFETDKATAQDGCVIASAKNNWDVYYKELITLTKADDEIPVDWVAGLEENATDVEVFENCCPSGIKQTVDELKEDIISGDMEVFDIDKFTVNGKKQNSAFVTDTDGDDVADEDQAIFESAFHESYFRSAPYFSLEIDGITILN